MSEAEKVGEFYDGRSSKGVKDYIRENARVQRQLHFLRDAIPLTAHAVLIVGAGVGESAYFTARKVAPHAEVCALDISQRNTELAKALFCHRNITYSAGDILSDDVDGEFDVIVVPDSYEHIAVAGRPVLHEKLGRLLSAGGRILLTVPSPGHQRMLMEQGEGLQIVDETVTLECMQRLADDIDGIVSYFAMISVWRVNDYIHVMIEREPHRVRPMEPGDRIPLKMGTSGRQGKAKQVSDRLCREVRRRWKMGRAYWLLRKSRGRMPRTR